MIRRPCHGVSARRRENRRIKEANTCSAPDCADGVSVTLFRVDDDGVFILSRIQSSKKSTLEYTPGNAGSAQPSPPDTTPVKTPLQIMPPPESPWRNLCKFVSCWDIVGSLCSKFVTLASEMIVFRYSLYLRYLCVHSF